jgi:rubrerythrin
LSAVFPNPFPGWQPWFWLAGGALAWLAIATAVFVNPRTGAQVVADLLRAKFDAATIKDLESRRRIEKALEYRKQIEATIGRARAGLLRDNLLETAAEMDEWLENMYSLAVRLDAYEADRTIQQDMQSVPSTLATYEQRLKTVTDAKLRGQMQEIYDSKKKQWESLQTLNETMVRARLQMDNTLSAMGTVYSQMLLIGVKDIDSGRARRLREDIAEEIKGLHDVVTAMDEVYQVSH